MGDFHWNKTFVDINYIPPIMLISLPLEYIFRINSISKNLADVLLLKKRGTPPNLKDVSGTYLVLKYVRK